MKRKIFLTLCFIMIVASTVYGGDNRVGLTLIPPGTITNKVDLDIRAGIVNQGTEQQDFKISIYLNNVEQQSLLHYSTITLPIGASHEGVSKSTPSFLAQSPDFHKLGLCYYLKILYL